MSKHRIMSAKAAALRSAEAVAREHPGHTITRVAVRHDSGFEITTRTMYEEACSEKDWIGQATAIFEEGKMHSDFET
jgi:hypothetical protein